MVGLLGALALFAPPYEQVTEHRFSYFEAPAFLGIGTHHDWDFGLHMGLGAGWQVRQDEWLIGAYPYLAGNVFEFWPPTEDLAYGGGALVSVGTTRGWALWGAAYWDLDARLHASATFTVLPFGLQMSRLDLGGGHVWAWFAVFHLPLRAIFASGGSLRQRTAW